MTPMNKTRDLQSLLQCQDRQFVEAAYMTILKRRPDIDGFNFYLARLRSGVRKIQILSEIGASPEARVAAVELPGLRDALWRQKFVRIPLLGGFFKSRLRIE